MALLNRLQSLFSSEEHAVVHGDEAPPEAVDFPTADPYTIEPDEGDALAEAEARMRP